MLLFALLSCSYVDVGPIDVAVVDARYTCGTATAVAMFEEEVVVGCATGMSVGVVGTDPVQQTWRGEVTALVSDGIDLAVVGSRDGSPLVEDYISGEALLSGEDGFEGTAVDYATGDLGARAALLDDGRLLLRAPGGERWRTLGEDEVPADPDRFLTTHQGLLMAAFSEGDTLALVPFARPEDRRTLEQDAEVRLTGLQGTESTLVAVGVDRSTGIPRVTSFPDGLWEEPVVWEGFGPTVTLADVCGVDSHLLVVGEEDGYGVAWESTDLGRSWYPLELGTGPLVACFADEIGWAVAGSQGEVHGGSSLY